MKMALDCHCNADAAYPITDKIPLGTKFYYSTIKQCSMKLSCKFEVAMTKILSITKVFVSVL